MKEKTLCMDGVLRSWTEVEVWIRRSWRAWRAYRIPQWENEERLGILRSPTTEYLYYVRNPFHQHTY
jgi:hypothetical protein